MKKLIVTALCVFSVLGGAAQQKKAAKNPRVVLITLDGFRWQELFSGADSKLIIKKYAEDTTAVKERFWRNTPQERREALMPFFWNQVTKMGQLHGNRTLGSNVNLTNTMWFSYPGYNEILTGSADNERIHRQSFFYFDN